MEARTAVKRGAQALAGPIQAAEHKNRTSVATVLGGVVVEPVPRLLLLAAAATATTSSTRVERTGKQPKTRALRPEGIWPLRTLKPTRTPSTVLPVNESIATVLPGMRSYSFVFDLYIL